MHKPCSAPLGIHPHSLPRSRSRGGWVFLISPLADKTDPWSPKVKILALLPEFSLCWLAVYGKVAYWQPKGGEWNCHQPLLKGQASTESAECHFHCRYHFPCLYRAWACYCLQTHGPRSAIYTTSANTFIFSGIRFYSNPDCHELGIRMGSTCRCKTMPLVSEANADHQALQNKIKSILQSSTLTWGSFPVPFTIFISRKTHSYATKGQYTTFAGGFKPLWKSFLWICGEGMIGNERYL